MARSAVPRSLNYLTVTIAAVFVGCAWVHQDATLKLDPAITPSSIGRNATVTVNVLDPNSPACPNVGKMTTMP